MTDRKRFSIQTAAALLQNANFKGFFTGRIYQGASKSVCVPGLNCYSCPGAVGACPLGSLQSFLGSRPVKLPYYVAGLLLFFGALLGRAVCGFLCPMGWLQELLHRIPFPKKLRGDRASGPLRRLKYVVLALTVVLPLFFALTPFFCKYLCPAGTLAGVFLALADAAVRPLLGGIFAWKAAVLVSLAPSARSTACATASRSIAARWTGESASAVRSAPRPAAWASSRKTTSTAPSASAAATVSVPAPPARSAWAFRPPRAPSEARRKTPDVPRQKSASTCVETLFFCLSRKKGKTCLTNHTMRNIVLYEGGYCRCWTHK